ncbi:MAG: CRTAC1 family protein [Planctomycetota bacterium]|nr:CRTAC1 family protein [Planctomycetota bacterium]
MSVAGQDPFNEEHDDAPERDDDSVIGRAFLGSIAIFACLGLIFGTSYYFLRGTKKVEIAVAEPISLPERREMPTAVVPTAQWTDITDSAGIHFVHNSGAAGEKLLPETMGGGCAFFDYDADGDQDLLLVNACAWPNNRVANAPDTTLALFQNDGTGKFTDVTKETGLDLSVYGMGVACGDYDADGYIDLFISCLGEDRLFHNEKGRFRDVTEQSGVGGDAKAWSVSSGWFDYDNDGDLDLLVCHYVEWTREFDLAQEFRLLGGKERAYGGPQRFGGSFPSLFRNNGGGKFSDVSKEAGFQVLNPATSVPMGKSLGLVFEDFDNDGFLDCVIANDTVQNFLFHNQGNGQFEEVGAMVGVAFDATGAARGAMGIDAAAFRNNMSVGVAIGNFANEMSALYVSKGRSLQFYDEAVANGFGPATRLELTFGVLFMDFDLDGRLDIFQSNGHLEEDIAKVQASQRYAQSPQLFWNAGPEFTTEFVKCRDAETGPDFQKPMVGRGASYADIDNDGDLDVIAVGCGQKPRLLRNDQKLQNHWVRVKLVGKGSNRDAIGALVEIQVGEQTQSRRVNPTRSYLSQVELPVTFGLGMSDEIDRMVIHWPNGKKQTISKPQVDRLLVIEQPELQ